MKRREEGGRGETVALAVACCEGLRPNFFFN